MMPSPTRRQPFWALLIAATTMVAGNAAPATPSDAVSADVAAHFAQAAQKFEEARAGSAAAVAPAQAAFKDLVSSDPTNPLFNAYYGSTFAMQARDGGLPWQKIKWVDQSIDKIDHALSLLAPQHDTQTIRGIPVSLETRLVAIATYVPLPALFNRMQVAKQQLAWVMASPQFANASTELRGRFYYEDALIAHSDGDAERERRSLREVVKDAPPSLNMTEVRDQLAKLGG